MAMTIFTTDTNLLLLVSNTGHTCYHTILDGLNQSTTDLQQQRIFHCSIHRVCQTPVDHTHMHPDVHRCSGLWRHISCRYTSGAIQCIIDWPSPCLWTINIDSIRTPFNFWQFWKWKKSSFVYLLECNIYQHVHRSNLHVSTVHVSIAIAIPRTYVPNCWCNTLILRL